MKTFHIVALIVVGAAMLGSERTALAAVTFSTFVSTGDIAAAENGQTNTIGFTYAGDEFVGSLYFGTNNLQLTRPI